MKGSFEDLIGYFLIAAIFIIGFLPIMADFVTQAQAIAEPKTAMVLGFLIPFILIILIVGFFMRVRGQGSFGEW